MGINNRKTLVIVFVFIISNLIFGVPADTIINKINEAKIVDKLYMSLNDKSVVDVGTTSLPTFTNKAYAANFTMQTGYYVGNGSTQAISGVGFQPELLIIKSDTTASQAIWKSSAMPANTSAFFGATANNTGTLITFQSDGFSVANNAATNTANVRYTWTAFDGSDCSASGTLCVGTYSGNNTSPRLINTGFQPDHVMVKRTTNAVSATFRTSAMAANMGQYFNTTAQNTTGALFTTLAANGFNIGATNNGNGNTYYYAAFKAVTGVMAVGTYTGNYTDNRNITGFGNGSTPNLVMVKNATSGTAARRDPVMNNTHSFGDYSSFISSTSASSNNKIQALQDDGFQIGGAATSAYNVNENTITHYWSAWGGAAALPSGSGSFQMATGTYTGNGSARTISGIGFDPDLVIIKDNAAQQGVFRTALMAGDNTAYLASATANFTGGITALGTDSFNLGTSGIVNTNTNTYHWQAFSGAYKPQSRSGATDFMIGAYTGSGTDNRSINDTPAQPDMVAVKRSGATAGVWRSTANSGDQSSFFANTADGANRVQSLTSSGFQIGTNANVNTAGNLYNWFGFRTGDNFSVNSYTGSGGVQSISSVGFQPDLLWVKRSTNQQGVQRPSTLAGNNTQYFSNIANSANRITALVCNGFSLTGTTAETNTNGGTYRYAAWKVPTSILTMDIVDSNGCSVANPAVSLSNTMLSFSCSQTTGTLGTNTERLRITNTTSNPNWSLAIAATSGNTSLWDSGGTTYDFNDSSGSPAGCADGLDADSGQAGQLSIDPSTATITPKSGCATSGISLGGASSFQQAVLDSLTIATASSANTSCFWDITNIGVSQRIPPETSTGAYNLNLTITITAN